MGAPAAEIEAVLKVVDAEPWHENMKTEAPRHRVVLTHAVYLSVNKVTQAEYEKVMGTTPSYFSQTGGGRDKIAGMDTSRYPVETVSWNDAAEFCARLSQKEKLKPFYFRAGNTITSLDGIGYRLASEAEWEFACRAGTTTQFWTGDKDEDLLLAGWFRTNSGMRTHAVGELNANPLGLFDTHGNLLECVGDCWEPTYYQQFADKPAVNPKGPSSVSVVPWQSLIRQPCSGGLRVLCTSALPGSVPTSIDALYCSGETCRLSQVSRRSD